MIAVIADYNNGNYDDYFALYEIAKIERKNGDLSLTNKQ